MIFVCSRWHPDKHLFNKARAEERFKLIAAAYTTLSDPEQCRRYDQVRGELVLDKPLPA